MACARKYINCSQSNIITALQNRTDMVRLHKNRGGGGGGLLIAYAATALKTRVFLFITGNN
jgi:hypothetical protein